METPVPRLLREQETTEPEKRVIVEMTNIYVWVRTARSLHFFYPIAEVDTDSFGIYYDLCLEVVASRQSCGDKISFNDFEILCKNRISEEYLEAIFQNAVERGDQTASVKLLTLSLLFGGLQQKTSDLKICNRADIVLTRIGKYFGQIFKLLFQLDAGKRMQDREIVEAIAGGQGYEFLDTLFEGTVKRRHGNSNHHGVRPLSHIIPLIMEKSNSISLPFLCNEIRRHLIKDPYHIDEFLTDKTHQVSTTARRTTLAHNSRRVVHLHYINKIEVLRKDEFANIHLRICHDKPKASFIFAPLRSETVFIDSLTYTKWIVLGAVCGLVVVKNCQTTRISVSCDQLIVLSSKNLEIYSMSPKKPIILNSSSITFAPLNTTYEGQEEFLDENGHSFNNNTVLKEPINFGDGSWKLMETSKFVCQHTPLNTTTKQFESLINSLPEEYRLAHYRNTTDTQKLMATEAERNRIADVASNFDMLYLKSKMEKNRVDGDD